MALVPDHSDAEEGSVDRLFQIARTFISVDVPAASRLCSGWPLLHVAACGVPAEHVAGSAQLLKHASTAPPASGGDGAPESSSKHKFESVFHGDGAGAIFEVALAAAETEHALGTEDDDGFTALAIASKLGHHEWIARLLEARSPGSHRADLRASPLTIAACNGHTMAVKLLLGPPGYPVTWADGKIDILEKRGRKTALKYAEEHNHESCAKYLREMTGRKLIEAARLGDLQTLAAALSTISPDFVPTSTALLGEVLQAELVRFG